MRAHGVWRPLRLQTRSRRPAPGASRLLRRLATAALALAAALLPSACGAGVLAPPPARTVPVDRVAPPAQVGRPFALASAPMSRSAAARLPRPAVAGARPLGHYEAPAVMYGVWDPSRGAALRAFGLSDRGTRAPARVDQSFRIGSVTKTFTATAVLLLVDDGRVRLDAPVARYVGDLVDGLPGGRRATVRGLLGMTSGFPDYGGRGDGPFATAVLAPHRIWTPAQVVRLAGRFPPDPRGSFFSNTNYAILGELVARRSGMSFGAFVQRRILVPLGLRDTRIPSPTVAAPVAMRGYLDATWASFSPPPSARVRAAGQPGEDVTSWSTSAAGAAAGGVSTLADLARAAMPALAPVVDPVYRR